MVSDYFGANAWLKQHKEQMQNLLPEEVLSVWNVYGCMKVKATSENSHFRAMGTSVINNVVGQRVSAANVWGEKVAAGTQLYFVLKKNASDVWTFYPYASPDHRIPPISKEGIVGGSDDKKSVGTYVFVGTAMSNPMSCVEGVAATRRFVGGIEVCIGL